MITTSYTLPPHGFGTPWSLAVRQNLQNRRHARPYLHKPREPNSNGSGGDILIGMQTRYLLVASLITGLVILVAAAVWMATRL